MIKIILFLVMGTFLHGFMDNDFDGVDDSVDRCLNTPFKYVVDVKGCPNDKLYIGTINVEFQHTLQTIDNEKYTLDSIYLDYDYNNYLLSLSNFHYGTKVDTTLSIGYVTYKDDISMKVYLGVQDSLKREYFCSFGVDYFKNDFLYFGNLEYKNISKDISLLFGLTYFIKDYELTLSYSDIYKDADVEVLYSLSDMLYIKSGYSLSLNDDSHSIYFSFGVSFE